MSIINTSRPTLSHISFPADIYIPEVAALLPLFNYYFPSLTSIHLGVWVEDPDPAINKAMSLFLIARTHIRHLSLGFGRDEGSAIVLTESAVTSEMLPHLKSFHGHVNNITIMARRGVRSLKTIIALSVGHSFHWTAAFDMTTMFLELERLKGLPELKEFRFEPGSDTESNSHQISQWMVKLSRICPGLKRWSGAAGGKDPVRHTTFLLPEFELIAYLLGRNCVVIF
jgi:hypothetical protein